MLPGTEPAAAHANKRSRGKDVEPQAPAQAPPSLFGIELRGSRVGMRSSEHGRVLLNWRVHARRAEYMTQTAVIMQEVTSPDRLERAQG